MQVRTVSAQRSVAGIHSFAIVSPDERPPTRRGRRPGLVLRGLACVGMVLGLGAMVANFMAHDANAVAIAPALPMQAEAAPPQPAKPVWIEVKRPIQLYDLSGSAFGKLPLAYRAKRMSDDSARQDLLAYGSFADRDPYLELSLLRSATPDVEPPSLLVDLARLAADAGLAVTRSGVPTRLPTRFGVFAAADITVTHGAASAACLGFRLQADPSTADPLGIKGFACGTAGRAMDRSALACVLDRIDLVSAGGDAVLQDFFVRAERRRGQRCGGSPLLAAGARSLWLDSSGQPPSLRRLAGGDGKLP